MTRPFGNQVRNVDHIRSLLRQMDRSVDDARSRREGVPQGETPSASPPPAAAPSAPSTPTPAATNPMASASGNATPAGSPAPRPLMKPNPAPQTFANGNGLNGAHPAGTTSSGPPRLKAKPKRSSSDPLQDFQQRQAS